jgi:hypothetical protein
VKTAVSNLWASAVRTYVPYIVAWVVAQLINMGVQPDPEFEFLLGSALTLILGSVYHFVVRLLETHVSPLFGRLLGSAKQPVAYAKLAANGTPIITDVAQTAKGEVTQLSVRTLEKPSGRTG